MIFNFRFNDFIFYIPRFQLLLFRLFFLILFLICYGDSTFLPRCRIVYYTQGKEICIELLCDWLAGCKGTTRIFVGMPCSKRKQSSMEDLTEGREALWKEKSCGRRSLVEGEVCGRRSGNDVSQEKFERELALATVAPV